MGDTFFTDPGQTSEPSTPEREGDQEVRTINTPSMSQPTTLSEGAPHVREISNAPSANSESSDQPQSRVRVGTSEPGRDRGMSNAESNEDSWNRGGEVKTHQEELRCVIAVIRHGDRTPKQKGRERGRGYVF